MGERTIRKYRDQGELPSQQPRPPRTYRTRIDPLEPYWAEIKAFLEADSRLKPMALLDWLKQKYNDPETGRGADHAIRFGGRWNGGCRNGNSTTGSSRRSSFLKCIMRGT